MQHNMTAMGAQHACKLHRMRYKVAAHQTALKAVQQQIARGAAAQQAAHTMLCSMAGICSSIARALRRLLSSSTSSCIEADVSQCSDGNSHASDAPANSRTDASCNSPGQDMLSGYASDKHWHSYDCDACNRPVQCLYIQEGCRRDVWDEHYGETCALQDSAAELHGRRHADCIADGLDRAAAACARLHAASSHGELQAIRGASVTEQPSFAEQLDQSLQGGINALLHLFYKHTAAEVQPDAKVCKKQPGPTQVNRHIAQRSINLHASKVTKP